MPPFFCPVGNSEYHYYFSRGKNHHPKEAHHFSKMVAPTSRVKDFLMFCGVVVSKIFVVVLAFLPR